MKHNYSSEHAIAALETAALMAVLVPVVIAGLGLGALLHRHFTLQHMLEKHAYDEFVVPIELTNTGSLRIVELPSSLDPTLRSNPGYCSASLSRYLECIADHLEQELTTTDFYSRGTVSSQRYQITAKYAVIGIDPQTGLATGLLSFNNNVQTRGSLIAPLLMDADIAALANSNQLPSSLATPVARYDAASGSDNRYLPFAVVAGLELAFQAEGGLIDVFLSQFNSNSGLLHDFRIVSLRGEVSDD